MTSGIAAPVIVTGGSRGIGRAVVERLAADGYRVLFTYNANEHSAKELCAHLEQKDLRAECTRCDLRSPEEVDRLAAWVLEHRGSPYALVCNAGISSDALAPSIDLEQSKALFQVNFFSTVQLVKALSRPMARSRSGRIVLMSSVLSGAGMRGTAMYAASKASLESYVRGVVDEVARKGVTINYIRPGLISTDMTSHHTATGERALGRIPARRFGLPEDVAGVVSFLLSPSAAYVNGTSIVVDGGMTSVLGWQ